MEFILPKDNSSIIKVIGVGGGGSNAVNHMYKQEIKGVDFIVCNTDKQALDNSPVFNKILLGESLTKGRGAGAIPQIGKEAAQESIHEVQELLHNNTDMLFITAGMGGGTGTGAAPEIARVAMEQGILTVGIVTVPFKFEGKRRHKQAQEGIEELRKNVDALIVINNERLREFYGNNTISQAFAHADEVLTQATKGIAQIITLTGIINLDFNDVRTVMQKSEVALMGNATTEGENRATKAVQQALSSPLLNDNDIKGARHVLLYITYGNIEITMDEITEITDHIQDAADGTAEMVYGAGLDETLGDKINVVVIATGFQSAPILGIEREPQTEKIALNKETKVEIIKPLVSPVQTHKNTTQNMFSSVNKTIQVKTQPTTKPELNFSTAQPINTQFDWDISNHSPSPNIAPTIINAEPQLQRFTLNDDQHEINTQEIDKQTNIKQEPNKTSQAQQLAQQRLSRIQELTAKLRKPEGVLQVEKEPAYIRHKISLNTDAKISVEDPQTSRLYIDKDEKGNTQLKTNNSFLHDNVD